MHTKQEVQQHEGGCACRQVRYIVTGEPKVTAVCHCEYCQQRTGSAFGVLVYFKTASVEKLSGNLKEYEHKTDFGYTFNNEFCTNWFFKSNLACYFHNIFDIWNRKKYWDYSILETQNA